MRLVPISLASLIVLSLAVPSVAAAHRRHTTSQTSAKAVSRKHVAKSAIVHQRSIDTERATEIQQALIKAGYLTGEPSGHWDPESQAAMQKVQADNGWQTKLVPDSRALIKLGLGPNNGSSKTATASETASGADGILPNGNDDLAQTSSTSRSTDR